MSLFTRASVVATLASSAFSLTLMALPAAAANASLSLGDAIKATLQSNPQLQGYEFRTRALAGERQTAALAPPLQVSTALENIAGSGEFQGTDAGELTLSLSSVIELGGQRAARLGLLSARQQQLDSSQHLLTLDLLSQVARQFIALAAAQQQLLLLQQSRGYAQEAGTTLARQVQAGLTHEAELLRAKAALARVEIDIQKTRQQLSSEAIKLSAYWAETQPTFTEVDADLFALPPEVPLADLIRRLDNNPDLAVLGDQVYLRAAELQQARAERTANLEWSAGVRRLQASNDSALVVGLSMPLGASGRTSGAIVSASAHQASAEQERSSTRIQLHAQLLSLHSDYQQALAEVSALRSQVLPPLRQAMNATISAFNQGRYSYLELNLAQRELLDSQLALVAAAARSHLLRIDIERLTGSALGRDTINEAANNSAGSLLP